MQFAARRVAWRVFEELQVAGEVAAEAHVAEGSVIVGKADGTVFDFSNPWGVAAIQVDADAATVQHRQFVARGRIKAQRAVDELFDQKARIEVVFKHGVFCLCGWRRCRC